MQRQLRRVFGVSLGAELRGALLELGADIVGFGDMTALPAAARAGLPRGVAIAAAYPRAVIRGIGALPTAAYYAQYGRLNERLDALAEDCAARLVAAGYRALAQTREYVERFESDYATPLPHKTVATRAGLGWIGKSALLVTEEYGGAVRLTSVLTDAPLDVAVPVDVSRCGGCTACAEACPGGAVSGRAWYAGLAREAFFDAPACRKAARERALRGFGVEITQCGKCIEVCPWTRRWLAREEVT